jgi:type III pantothenate kinase
VPDAVIDQSINETGDSDPWGSDTASAVALGSVHALGALADRLYDRLAERGHGPGPAILLTGGDASRLAGVISRPCELVPDLVLQGLARLAGDNP